MFKPAVKASQKTFCASAMVWRLVAMAAIGGRMERFL
jgi:hypothetical protein